MSEACPACFELLLENETAFKCGHIFHQSCCTNWIKHSGTELCPSCHRYGDLAMMAVCRMDLRALKIFLEKGNKIYGRYLRIVAKSDSFEEIIKYFKTDMTGEQPKPLELLKFMFFDEETDASYRHFSTLRMYERIKELRIIRFFLEGRKNYEYVSLREMAKLGFNEVVREMIEAGIDFTSGEHAALLAAARHGYLEILKLLHESGSNPRAHGDLALVEASQNGHLSVVEFLLSKGCNVRAKKGTPLRLAIKNSHFEIVKILVAHGACTSANINNTLIYAARENHLSIAQLLLEQGADVHIQNDKTLRKFAQHGNIEALNYLFLNYKPFSQEALNEILIAASQWGRTAAVKLLIENGADPSCLTS